MEAGAAASGQRAVVYTIDGTRNPELFLPTELFDALLSGLQPNAAKAVRQRAFYGKAIERLGYDETTFWSKLESASAPYLPIRFQTGNLAVGGQPDVKCHERFAALQAARRAFGPANFNQLLYEVVAPTMQFSEASADPDPIAMHLRIEKGCE